MKLLLVEDSASYATTLVDEVHRTHNVDVTVASNLAEALTALAAGPPFDLVVCDLEIPSAPDTLDKDVSHGMEVRGRVSLEFPGTPIIVHSAFMTLDYVDLWASENKGSERIMVGAEIVDVQPAPDVEGDMRVWWTTSTGQKHTMRARFIEGDGWYVVKLAE